LPEEDKEETTFEEFIREDYEWHLILMEEVYKKRRHGADLHEAR